MLNVGGAENLLFESPLHGAAKNLCSMALQDVVQPIDVVEPLPGSAVNDLGEVEESRLSEFQRYWMGYSVTTHSGPPENVIQTSRAALCPILRQVGARCGPLQPFQEVEVQRVTCSKVTIWFFAPKCPSGKKCAASPVAERSGTLGWTRLMPLPAPRQGQPLGFHVYPRSTEEGTLGNPRR